MNVFFLFVKIPAQFRHTKQWQGPDDQQIAKTTSLFLIYLGLHGWREWRCSVSVLPSLPFFSHPQICLCITPPAAKSCWTNPFSLCVWVLCCHVLAEVATVSGGFTGRRNQQLFRSAGLIPPLPLRKLRRPLKAHHSRESSLHRWVLILIL